MYKVLLVDDEDIIREGIVSMVPWERLNIQLAGCCSNAFEAMDNMVDVRPDILISDIKMPQMDGLELIERALKLYPELHAIVLSGYDDFEYARKAIKLGVKEYLLKPCDKEELIMTLERVLEVLAEKKNKSDELMDERSKKIKELKERFMMLGANEEGVMQLENKIKSMLLPKQYEGVIVESLFSLVVERSKNSPDMWCQMEMIQNLYSENGQDIVRCAAQILHQISAGKGRRKGFVQEICTYIQENYMDQGLSLQYVAEHVVHMNVDYVGKEFARDCGMKFSKYLLKVRMEHAKRLIAEDSEMPFYEVAEKTGYGDNPQYFSVMFKKVCGMTPKAYRDKLTID